MHPPFVMSEYASREDLLADASCYYENLLKEVALFLADLPQDLGRGSLNGFKVQLQQKIADAVNNT